MADLASLERRSGRGRAGQKPVLVPEDHLPVGAHVDEQAYAVPVAHAAGHHVGHHVPAHVAGPSGNDQHRGVRVQLLQPQVPGGEAGRQVGHRDVRLMADTPGVQPQEGVHHGGVPGDHHRVDLLAAHLLSVPGADLPGVQGPGQHVVDSVDYRLTEHIVPMVLPVHDAGQDILPVHQLAVVVGDLGEDLPAVQVHQLQGHRGGADVHGHPEVARGLVPGLDVHQTAAVQEGGRRPLALSHGLRNVPQKGKGDLQPPGFQSQCLA